LTKLWHVISVTAALSMYACSVHTIDVQQGNAIAPEAVAQLKMGMTRKQVEFIMGTPLVSDPFHRSRWDYVYLFEQQNKARETRHLSLFFEGDKLVRIAADSEPAITAGDPETGP